VRGLENKVAVVAGGGSGIGASTAVRLAEEGVAVMVGDLAGDNAAGIAKAIADNGGRATSMEFDIADEESVVALLDATVAQFGGLDLLHANAADLSPGNIGRDSDAVSLPLDVFDRTIEVNLRGHLLCTRHAIDRMLERGGGAIVYTSSAASFIGEPERPSYAMAKAGINALARHVASKWGKQGIRANAVAPGLVLTRAIAEDSPIREWALKSTRSPRLGQPEDIASAVAFLMSADGEWINGQVLSVDGGATLR
jgi:NAD(P)-dependent dehydrogenase (short-subunit alcohol dehydrogenase family)